jgi:hypothetical protein
MEKNKDKSEKARSAVGAKEGIRNRPFLQRKKHHSIWNACEEAQQAANSRKAQESERLNAAAHELGFIDSTDDVWWERCPHCDYFVQLYTTPSGHIDASSANPRCAMVPKLRAHLRNGGPK